MAPYPENGSLTTDKREIDDSDGWDSQSDWEAYQSASNVEIVDGRVQLEEITLTTPESAEYQFDARTIDADDGDPISSWDASVGGVTASGGSPTYRESAMNGNPALEFDGAGDNLDASAVQVDMTNTIIAVVEILDGSGQMHAYDGITQRQNMSWRSSAEWGVWAGGDQQLGSSDSTHQLITGIYETDSLTIRENGSQTGSGVNPDNSEIDGLRIGDHPSGGASWDGYISFLELHTGQPSNSVETREQEIADVFGITLS